MMATRCTIAADDVKSELVGTGVEPSKRGVGAARLRQNVVAKIESDHLKCGEVGWDDAEDIGLVRDLCGGNARTRVEH